MSPKAVTVADNGEDQADTARAGPARATMRLAKLLRGIDAGAAASFGDVEISEIAYDSRRVKPGTLFVAIRGEKTDGNKFVADVMLKALGE